MKFLISRCSQWSDKDPQAPGAYKEGKYWYVNIDTLEQLLSLAGKNPLADNGSWEHQAVIVGGKHWETGEPTIEIYDDWRE